MEQCIGMQFVHSWRKHSKRKSDDAHKKIGFVIFNKAATKRDSNIAWIQKENWCMFVQFSAYRWCNHPTGIDESCVNSVQLERIYLSQRFCLQPSFYHKVWTRGKRKKREGKLFSSRLLIHSEVMHTKRKDRVKINQNQEMFIITAIGETIKTPCTGSQGRWGPQSGTRTGGGGPARVPNLRVRTHQRRAWHTQGRKGALTSCRGTV